MASERQRAVHPQRAARPRAQSTNVAPARRCAYAVVRRCFEQGAYADRALQAQARDLDSRDRSLAMRLAYGTIQRRATLDHIIERLSERPLGQLDQPLLMSLRLGLYELVYSDGAPDRAVVSDAVQLAKDHARAGHGLVNAILRRAAREGALALLADLRDDTAQQTAIMHSHPEWVARLWWQQLGAQDARALMAADNEPGEVALRVNTLVASDSGDRRPSDPAAIARELGIAAHPDPRLPEALVLDQPLDLHSSAAWRTGAVIAQSRAAMLVAHALDPQPGERVLDLCAAPGGKSTHIAALMAGEGEVLAVERSPVRAKELSETVRRLHADCVRVELGDAAQPRSEERAFDRVLVDPPCSGLGTLQARPDLRWRLTPEKIVELADVQAKILGAAAPALRPGGVLVYSTCTISAAENEQQVEQFLSYNSDFVLEDLVAVFPDHAHPRAPKVLLTLPHRDRTAGFFIARMRRVDR